MENRHVGALAGIVSVLGLAAQHVPSLFVRRWVEGGLDGALPMVGTAGQTVTTYALVANSVGPLAAFLLAIGFGYYAGRRFDVAREYRRFGGAVAVGSVASVAVVWAVWMYGVQSTPMDASGVLMSLAILANAVVAGSLVVTVGAFAGAALSYFRTDNRTPARPTDADANADADADSSVTVGRNSSADDSDVRSSTT